MTGRGNASESDPQRQLIVVVEPETDADPEALDQLVRQLRTELRNTEVEDVEPINAPPAPEGAKGADPYSLGALLVTLSAAGGVFSLLIETARDWLGRQAAAEKISVTIDGDTLVLEKSTRKERGELIEAYIRRHEVE
jgi:Effector Associated Constant Component 1